MKISAILVLSVLILSIVSPPSVVPAVAQGERNASLKVLDVCGSPSASALSVNADIPFYCEQSVMPAEPPAIETFLISHQISFRISTPYPEERPPKS